MASLINALPGSAAQGLIWGILAIGVYITYKVLDYADLTVDGSLATGGAVAVMCIIGGMDPYFAMVMAFGAGMLGAGDRPVPYSVWHPANPVRYPDPAWPVFRQYADFREIQPGSQRGPV